MELEQWEDEFNAHREILFEYEASDLVQEAVKWEIDADPEWRVELIDIDYHRMPKMQSMAWLNETGRTKLRKQIRDARFAYWKGWADILVPPLALAVALLPYSRTLSWRTSKPTANLRNYFKLGHYPACTLP